MSTKIYPAAFVGILLFAWFWNSAFAGLGFMPLDQSVLLDGAWRLHQGQVPWKDFLLCYGLITQVIQWGYFEAFGVSYDSYIALGSTQNLLGTLLVLLLARRLLPGRRGLQLLAGFITAFWFQAPFGTPWVEQTAFLFCLAILLLLVPAPVGSGRAPHTGFRAFLSGLLLFLVFLSKQNVAALFLPLPLVLFVLDRREGASVLRPSLAYASGLAVAAITFALWLSTYAEPAQFTSSVFEYPAGMLLPRLIQDPLGVLTGPLFGTGKWQHRIVHLLGLLTALLWFRSSSHCLPAAQGLGGMRLVAWALIALALFTNIFHVVTNNSQEVNQPFLGLIIVMQIPLLRDVLVWRGLRERLWIWIPRCLCLLLAVLAIDRAVKVDSTRAVHDIFGGVRFEGHLDREGWNSLTWAKPFRIHADHEIPIEDVRSLLMDLETRDKNFFVWPGFQIFYPILGKPDPQPLNFFFWGISYPREYELALDQRMLRDLQKNDVRVVVLQDAWFSMEGNPRKLSDFPLVKSWIDTEFHESAQYGIFRVLVRKDGV